MKIAEQFKELFEKADAPEDMLVEEDYLDYGCDCITRSNTIGLHRVFISKANEIECTTDFARFVVFCCNNADIIQKALNQYETTHPKHEG